jgi:hypothetical protein
MFTKRVGPEISGGGLTEKQPKNKNGGDQLAPILAVLCDLLLLRSALHRTDDSTARLAFQRFQVASDS